MQLPCILKLETISCERTVLHVIVQSNVLLARPELSSHRTAPHTSTVEAVEFKFLARCSLRYLPTYQVTVTTFVPAGDDMLLRPRVPLQQVDQCRKTPTTIAVLVVPRRLIGTLQRRTGPKEPLAALDERQVTAWGSS